MTRARLLSAALALLALPLGAIEVGEDAPSETIRREFSRAYFRNGFHLLAREPATKVRRLGATGLVQEFVDAANAAGEDRLPHLALVKANTSDLVIEGVETVFQVLPRMYAYYSSVGANAAGYPTIDTNQCTFEAGNTCQYQVFDKNYALFAYERTSVDGQNFSVKDPIFTRWRALGIGQLGPATGAEENVTSGAGTGVTAAGQRFSLGAVYNISSGLLIGRAISVRKPIFDLYLDQGRHAGFLGLPTAEESVQANGRRRQSFEGGAIEWTAGSPPVLVLPVSSISVSASAPIERLNLGDSFTLTASLFSANGTPLDGRFVSWTTSNSRVLALEPNGANVLVRAAGGGSATVTAFSEGKTSRALTYFVTAPCCQIGEGAPTPAIQQSFLDAVTRNRLAVKLPAASPVRRAGPGYMQELASPDGAAKYLLLRSGSRPSTYVVASTILARYLALGGPAGSIGFPVSDVNAQGRQMFEGGALAGDPAVLVSGAILTRWAAQNYEAGPAGLPVSEPRAVLSFAATAGSVQDFRHAAIVNVLSGPLTGRAFLLGGPILARYAALQGPAGKFGLPVGEEVGVAGRRRQEFEGGAIDYGPGDTEASAAERARRPQIFANPSEVPAGSRVRIAAGGFDTGATLRISIGGRPDFLVKTETGAYAWEAYVPAGTPSGLVTLRAADVNGSALAVGAYLVQSAAETLAKVTKIRGDLQSGLPSARLPLPLRVFVEDGNGVALTGIPVRFNASPGARIEGASLFTDERGEAQAWLRMPAAELPALATAEAGRQVVTFSARVQASTFTNFPRFSQSVPGAFGGGGTMEANGALLAAAASIVRYLQNRGDAASPNGPAEVGALNSYLTDACVFDFRGEKLCDGFTGPPGAAQRNVNLWRLAAFAGGNLDVVPVEPSPAAIRDRLAAGSPVLLALSLSSGTTLWGSHFAAAIGVTGSGGIVVHDPSSAFAQSTLEHYLNGFTAGGRSFRATLAAAAALEPRSPAAAGFLLVSAESTELASPAGSCGTELVWLDLPASIQAPARAPILARFRYCDGAQPSYRYDLAAPDARTFITDLANPGALTIVAAGAWRIYRPESNWLAVPQVAALASGNAIVNAASFTPKLSPGVLAAVFGSGLTQAGKETVVEVDGQAASVLAATPFQVNFEIPPETDPGARVVAIRSPYGAVEKPVEIELVSPAIFALAGNRGAVLNQDGKVNAPETPARRGEAIAVYCTGLGATVPQGTLNLTALPVSASVGGRAVDTLFSGSAPGLAGVYQVNLRLPQDFPPGLALELRLRVGGMQSEPVLIAVE